MKKTFIWEIVSSFSSKEFKDFEKFIQSSAFNTRSDLIRLFTFFAKSIPQDNQIITKEDAFHFVYPNEKYNHQKLRLVLSYLSKVLEKYLVIRELDQMPFIKDEILTTALRRRKNERNFQKTLKQVQSKTVSQNLRNPNYYYTQYYLEYQNYMFISESGIKENLNLPRIDENLNFFIICTKLKQASLSLSHQTVSSDTYEIPLLDEIMQMAQQSPYKDIPFISIYSHLIKLFTTDTEVNFQDFKEKLFNHLNTFTHEEFRDIYLTSLNFCIKKINANQKDYFYEALDLYKKGLELELLFKKGKLSRSTYNNIVGIALRIDDPNWVKSFIHKYKDYLNSPYNITAFSLNMARLEFIRKNYAEALIYLQDADYKDLLNHMNAKILQAKIYYELEEIETLDSLLKSMRVFIRRKRKVGYHYLLWKNMIRYTEKLIRVNQYDKEAVAGLILEIKDVDLLSEREWLLGKLRE